PRSWISWGLGTSISATRLAGSPSNLLPHGVAAGLERAHEALRLLLEDLPALVEPLAGAALRLVGKLLSAAGDPAAVLGQELARPSSASSAARLRRRPRRRTGTNPCIPLRRVDHCSW